VLASVAGQPVAGVGYKDVLGMIKAGGRPLQLRFTMPPRFVLSAPSAVPPPPAVVAEASVSAASKHEEDLADLDELDDLDDLDDLAALDALGDLALMQDDTGPLAAPASEAGKTAPGTIVQSSSVPAANMALISTGDGLASLDDLDDLEDLDALSIEPISATSAAIEDALLLQQLEEDELAELDDLFP
jgi:hypothetical protein